MEKKKNNKSEPVKEILKTRPRQLKGVVVSDKMDKTVVVKVSRLKIHPKYKQRYKVTKRYKADDPQNQFKLEDKVIIQETKPISKDKKWKVISKY